jgi:hypothetical protein
MTTARKSATALAGCLAIAVPLVAAQALSAKGSSGHYVGPVKNTPRPEHAAAFGGRPTVEFWLKRRRGKPVGVARFFEWNVGYECTEGPSPGYPNGRTVRRYPTEHGGQYLGTSFQGRGLRVRQRRFSGTSSEPLDAGRMTVTGRIPRRGPATGTIRLFLHDRGDSDDPRTDCDSGVLRWTARPR